MTVFYKKVAELDCRFAHWLSSYRRPVVIQFFKLITFTAVGRAWFGVASILYLLNRLGIQWIENQTAFLHALLAPLLAWVLGQGIKKYFKRERPFQCLPNFTSLVGSPRDDSFPSLHAGSTVSFFVALLIVHHPLTSLVGIWAGLASFSRLYLGVHFLSDILGGVLLGILCGSLIYY